MDNIEKKYRKSIGSKIKIARSQTEYTQEKLAEKLSLSARYISQLERGVAFGSATTIVNLCKALNISSDFLFSDIIKSDSMALNELVSTNFLENYMQLDDYNKEVLNTMAKQLLKLQSNKNTKSTIS